MADARIAVTVTADTSMLKGLNQELVAVSNTAKEMAGSMKAAGLTSAEAGAAMRSAGISSNVLAAALKASGYEAESAAGKISGLDRAEAMAVARGGAMTVGMGGMGMAMGRVAAQVPSLASLLSAGFPVFGALLAIDVVGQLASKLEDFTRKKYLEEAAWQKIDHTALAAIDSEDKSLAGLEARIVELTSGKLAALDLELKLVGDHAVELAGHVEAMLSAVGKEFDEERSWFEKTEHLFAKGTAVPLLPGKTLGQEATDFGTSLAKKLDTEGTSAALKMVDAQLDSVYAHIRREPDDANLKKYAAELEHIQVLLAKGLTRESAEASEKLLQIDKERTAEAEKLKDMQDKVVLAAARGEFKPKEPRVNVPEKESEFFGKVELKDSGEFTRSLSERSAAEQKFRDEESKGDISYLNQRLAELQAHIAAELPLWGEEDKAKGASYERDLAKYRGFLNEKRGIGRQELDESLSGISQEITAQEAGYGRQRAALDQQFSLKKIGGANYVKAAQTEAEAEYATISAALERERSLVKDNLARGVLDKQQAAKQMEAIDKQQLKAREAMLNEEERAKREAARRESDSIKETARSWGSGMSRIVNEVLQGRLKLGAAFAEIGRNMVGSMIDRGISRVVTVWGTKLLEMLAAHVSFLAKMLGIDVAGGAKKVGVTVAADAQVVAADAAAGGAAAFASVIEALPFPENVAAAPGVAAGVNAAIIATGIPKFETGGVMVRTGAAKLEHGEGVLKPGQTTVLQNLANRMSAAGRDGATGQDGASGSRGGRGAPIFHFSPNINAVDAQGFDRLISRYTPQLLRQVRSAMRDGKLRSR